MKAKSFHCSKSGRILPLAQKIGSTLQCVCDKMPPAYPCDKDRIVFIGFEPVGGKAPQEVYQFCKDMDTDRTKAIAFYVLGGTDDTSSADPIIKDVESRGVKVVAKTLAIVCKSSFFKKELVTANDIAKVEAWAVAASNVEV